MMAAWHRASTAIYVVVFAVGIEDMEDWHSGSDAYGYTSFCSLEAESLVNVGTRSEDVFQLRQISII